MNFGTLLFAIEVKKAESRIWLVPTFDIKNQLTDEQIEKLKDKLEAGTYRFRLVMDSVSPEAHVSFHKG